MFASTFAGFVEEGKSEETPGAASGEQQVEMQQGGGNQAPPAKVLSSAPSGPTSATAVCVSARSAAQRLEDVKIVPATVGALVASVVSPPGFQEFLDAAGCDEHTAVDAITCIPESDVMDVLASIEIEGTPLTPVQKGQLIKAIRALYQAMGLEPPSLGAPLPPKPSASPVQPPSTFLVPAVPPQGPAAPNPLSVDSVALHQVVDQSVRAATSVMSFEDLAACRHRYECVTGAPPPEAHLPSIEQLSGLRALLAAGRVPFVDFSIWSPQGARVAKFRRAEATVFVAGEFVTKAIEGPSTPEAWDESWALFSVAMVSLTAASPGNLNRYASGIRTLRGLFPSKWSLILTTDLVIRSERWGRIREECARSPPAGFDPSCPWDFIIGSSSFGYEGVGAMWWQTNFVLPASLNLPSPSNAGMPKQTAGHKPALAIADRPRSDPAASSSKEVCTNYNSRSGKCKGQGPCPHGRVHKCSVCGGPHRACDRHGDKEPKGKGKGRGKGKGKKDSNGQASEAS